MGVESLTGFARKQNLCQPINIRQEIRNYRRKTGATEAIIIFDVMGFVHNFGGNKIELNLGGRQHIYLQRFRKFLNELNKAGATLVFFCDGQLHPDRNHVWCGRRNKEFKEAYNIISEGNPPSSHRFGCKTISKSLRKLIEDERLGRFVMSTQVDCDSAIAKYAVENRALAVVASDSDFLIYEGDFQWWNSDSIRMEQMTADRYDHKTFREHLLKLKTEQMKYFATIAGNDCTKRFIPRGTCRDHFHIAKFCRRLGSNQTKEQICRQIEKYMGFETTAGGREAVEKSIQSYNINFDVESSGDRMSKYCSSNVLIYAFKNGEIFQYDVNFLDFQQRNEKHSSLLDSLLEVFRKLGGILLKSDSDRNPSLKIVTKYSLNANYMLRQHQPIYPQASVNFDDLIFGTTSDDTRWNLVLWSLGMSPTIKSFLVNIPYRYVLTVLAVTFLHTAREITTLEADAFLIAQYNIFERGFNLRSIVVDSSDVHANTIRISQLFNRTITLLWDCFSVCGLSRLIPLDWFDGPYFNQLLQQFRQNDVYLANLKNIKTYRLFAQLDMD